MTISQAKAELKSYRHNLLRIARKQEDIIALRSRSELVMRTFRHEAVQHSHDPHAAEERIARLLELQRQQNELFLHTEARRIAVEQKIDALEQPYQNILYLHYIRDWSFTKISMEINYEYTWLCKLHAKAVQLYAKLDESPRRAG